jgi:hypothetical protein
MKVADRLTDTAFPRPVRPRILVARVPSQLSTFDTNSGNERICGEQWNTKEDFVLFLRFPLTIFVSSTATHLLTIL